MEDNRASYTVALQDFNEARRRAGLEAIIARLAGRSYDLLAYEDVRRKLKVMGSADQGLHDIPLDAIIGSVGRYADFTRTFLPKRDSDKDRWAKVKAVVTSMEGLPPIEVYKIGDAYFVKDGNHRVSVARQLGAKYIQAYVTEVHTRVPLSPDDQPDDLILKAEYAAFLERTRLDKLRPQANLILTVPGQYDLLEAHMQVHRYFMGLEQQRDISYEEAVAHWYDSVYVPVLQVIQQQGILRDFPDRTEADLYLWLAEHRAALEERLGWEVSVELAAIDLAAQSSARGLRAVAEKLLSAVTPDELEDGGSPGEWRRDHPAEGPDGRMFRDTLVPIRGDEAGWHALEQALEVARREGGRLLGLHVVPSLVQRESEGVQAVAAEFNRRCEAAGIVGKLAVEVGGIARKICERNRWTDLVVVNLVHPPPPTPVARLTSGSRAMLRRCASPILTVPGTASPLDRALLAYDGSRRAEEALYVAAYLAGRWGISLAVLSVVEVGRVSPDTLAHARQYLEAHEVPATFVQESAPAAEAILNTAQQQGSNFIIMGGYGYSPVLEVMLGSTVDQVLRAERLPTLICR